jgi:hypothetical protein
MAETSAMQVYENLLTNRIATVARGFALCALGQGYVDVNNFATGLSPVTLSTAPGTFNPADGAGGAFVGSNYSVSFFWLNGTVTNQTTFDSLNPVWVKDAIFWGTTGVGAGHGFDGDGSGFFDGGVAQLIGQVDFDVTVQIRAWYNGGGIYASYAEALAAGHNVGQSNLLPLYVTPPPGGVVPLTGLLPFTVGIPEPLILVLAAFGGSALLLFRRRRR